MTKVNSTSSQGFAGTLFKVSGFDKIAIGAIFSANSNIFVWIPIRGDLILPLKGTHLVGIGDWCFEFVTVTSNSSSTLHVTPRRARRNHMIRCAMIASGPMSQELQSGTVSDLTESRTIDHLHARAIKISAPQPADECACPLGLGLYAIRPRDA